MNHVRFAFAALVLAVSGLLSRGYARAQDSRDGEIAIIGSSVITAEDVDRIDAGRPSAHAGLPPRSGGKIYAIRCSPNT